MSGVMKAWRRRGRALDVVGRRPEGGRREPV